MTTVFPAIQDLARRILAIEAADTQVDEAVQVCEKLLVPLSRLAGLEGFSSLLRRALTLAKTDVPSLRVVQVRPDGVLAGFDEIKHDQDAGALEKGRVLLVAHLLQLLTTFVGGSLTQRLIRDLWPDAFIDNTDLRGEQTR